MAGKLWYRFWQLDHDDDGDEGDICEVGHEWQSQEGQKGHQLEIEACNNKNYANADYENT